MTLLINKSAGNKTPLIALAECRVSTVGCGGSHGPGGVLRLEARAGLYISRVRPIGMRAGASVQKALRSVPGDGGWPAWQPVGKWGSSTTWGVDLSALPRSRSHSPLVLNGRIAEWQI